MGAVRDAQRILKRSPIVLGAACLVLAGAVGAQDARPLDPAQARLAERVTWGIDAATAAAIARQGTKAWLDGQLHPAAGDRLPPAVQAQIEAMPYLQVPMIELVRDVQVQQQAAGAITDPVMKAAARQVANKAMDDAAGEAASRSLLRDLYSPDQLKEQMTWFRFNHFNVHQYKANVRLMVADYEERALRPHALGKFRDLLEATLRHPAMLRYLDNADNAAGHINENYAREIMELHTLGVGSGYSQQDVQELARILTGVGIDANSKDPQLPPPLRGQLIRDGLFEFNPARHDYGDKVFLGHAIEGRGFAEVEEALDILARSPATARHVSRELAIYFVADDPAPTLVDAMAATYQRTDGDIAKVLETMFRSPQFAASLGAKFKDPAHYAISAVRLVYGDQVILDTGPVLGWINSMGEGLYNHETPDGFSMVSSAWNGPGQMEARFELARRLGAGAAPLFKPPASASPPPPSAPTQPQGPPDLQRAVQAVGLMTLTPAATRSILAQVPSPRDWNTLFLSSPQFMQR
jgi:uncharacterized protein (DUF1800 family)